MYYGALFMWHHNIEHYRLILQFLTGYLATCGSKPTHLVMVGEGDCARSFQIFVPLQGVVVYLCQGHCLAVGLIQHVHIIHKFIFITPKSQNVCECCCLEAH